MSGGHFNYSGGTIQLLLDAIAEDESVRGRWPQLASRLSELGQVLYDIEHDIDWDFSSDSAIKISDQEFEALALRRLRGE